MHLRIRTKKQFSIKCTPRQKTLFSPFLLHRQKLSVAYKIFGRGLPRSEGVRKCKQRSKPRLGSLLKSQNPDVGTIV